MPGRWSAVLFFLLLFPSAASAGEEGHEASAADAHLYGMPIRGENGQWRALDNVTRYFLDCVEGVLKANPERIKREHQKVTAPEPTYPEQSELWRKSEATRLDALRDLAFARKRLGKTDAAETQFLRATILEQWAKFERETHSIRKEDLEKLRGDVSTHSEAWEKHPVNDVNLRLLHQYSETPDQSQRRLETKARFVESASALFAASLSAAALGIRPQEATPMPMEHLRHGLGDLIAKVSVERLLLTFSPYLTEASEKESKAHATALTKHYGQYILANPTVFGLPLNYKPVLPVEILAEDLEKTVRDNLVRDLLLERLQQERKNAESALSEPARADLAPFLQELPKCESQAKKFRTVSGSSFQSK